MDPSISLSPELLQALDHASGGPVFVVDATSGQKFVVLGAETFQSLAEEFSLAETYPAQDEALAAIWNEPELDDYNNSARAD